jgi:hypothetical protein
MEYLGWDSHLKAHPQRCFGTIYFYSYQCRPRPGSLLAQRSLGPGLPGDDRRNASLTPGANWRSPTSGKTPLCGNCRAWKAKSMWTSIVICRWIGSWNARAPFSALWRLVISRTVTWCSTTLPAATLKEPTLRVISSPSATIGMASGITNRW